jgi:hypothetical protein
LFLLTQYWFHLEEGESADSESMTCDERICQKKHTQQTKQ